MALILVTTFAMSIAKNPSIISNLHKMLLRDDVPLDETQLSSIFKRVFSEIFKNFCLFFDDPDAFGSLLNKLEKGLILDQDFLIYQKLKDTESASIEEQEDYKSYDFGGEPICMDCQLATYPNSDHNIEKMTNQYSKCQMAFTLHFDQSTHLDITDFSIKYSNLKSLQLLKAISLNENFFANLKELVLLEIIDDQLESLPSSIFSLRNLNTLKICNSAISDFHNIQDDLKELRSLVALHLENIHLKKSPVLMLLPSCLQKLHLLSISSNQLVFEVKETSLTEIKLTGVPWITDVGDKIYHNQFKIHFERFFSEVQLGDLFKVFDKNHDGCIGHTELIKLNSFIFKKFERLNSVPSSIFNIQSLTTLDLSFQAIRKIPDDIIKLTNLTTLILESCVYLSSISPKLANLPITQLNLNNCLSLKTPPPEIQYRGLNAVLSYLKRLMSGSVLFKRTKLMLVGLGEAGKTSLLNALRQATNKTQAPFVPPKVTDGINIKEWVVDLEDKTTLTYYMWDFAGQSVYYNTHQFFLSSRAIYILVWNTRLGSDYAGLDFWLSSISCHAPGAPVFIVGTHVDQVSLYTINKKSLVSRFKQIVGFHFVSSVNMTGIDELIKQLVKVTLNQKYIGEKIPEAWFNFEKKIKSLAASQSLISYKKMVDIAESVSLFNMHEILQAVRFLNDLGSLQYFEITGLKDKIVINPQWIVDVMACVVSVKKTDIVEGRLKYADIKNIWLNYEVKLHQWMLKLTETFDLTYSLADRELIIVPCLLPEKEPEFEWPEIVQSEEGISKTKEFLVLYKFIYIPGGLFNRIQVRLFNYADNSTIWKNGSLLKKNNHLALIQQSIDSTISVKVQGIKPQNIIFLIHEVIETLINEYFQGIKYDYSFPCPDCVDAQATDPCMFSASLVRRAFELKAPYLQCHKYFHAISIQEMLSMMPVEGASTIDMNLEYALRDLKQLRKNLKYDIAFWYCPSDVPVYTEHNRVDPMKLLEEIKRQKYNVWFSNNPLKEKMDRTYISNYSNKLRDIQTYFKDNLTIDSPHKSKIINI